MFGLDERFITGCWLFWSPMFGCGCCWIAVFWHFSEANVQQSQQDCKHPQGDDVFFRKMVGWWGWNEGWWMWTKTINLWELYTMWFSLVGTVQLCGWGMGGGFRIPIVICVKFVSSRLSKCYQCYLKKNKPGRQVCGEAFDGWCPHFYGSIVFFSRIPVGKCWNVTWCVSSMDRICFAVRAWKKLDGFTGWNLGWRLPKQHGI